MNKNRWIIIISYLFIGCSQQQPAVIKNAGTEIIHINGITTASMRHQSCFRAGRETICSDGNRNQIMSRSSGFISKGIVSHASNGNIQQTVVQSDAETATDVGVKAYPYIRALTNFFRNK
jgi:hypothetical protein